MHSPATPIAALASLVAVAASMLLSGVPAAQAQRDGLSGVPARLPNVLGRNRSLPIERQITLPGVSVPVPAVVGQPGYVYTPHYSYAPYGYRRDVITSGTGLTLDGSYTGDKWSISAHLGSGLRYTDRYRCTIGEDGRICYVPVYPAYPAYRSYSYYRGPIDGVRYSYADPTLQLLPPAMTQQAQQPPPPDPEPLTAIEMAGLAHATKDLEEAIEAYRNHLDDDPEDVRSMRLLGLAMLEDGRFEDGTAMLRLAYHTDPLLAREAVDLRPIGLTGRRYDTVLGRSMSRARRVDSGSGWLAVTVILQADGKTSGAARVLERAESAGLDAEICEALSREIGLPASRSRP